MICVLWRILLMQRLQIGVKEYESALGWLRAVLDASYQKTCTRWYLGGFRRELIGYLVHEKEVARVVPYVDR